MTPISIVIITLNEAERIGNLLSDLAQQTYRNFEVIVVDSNSDDDTCAIAQCFDQKLPALTVHQLNDRGVCLGRNTGATLAQYDRLLFLDADVRLSPHFLDNAMRQLNQQHLQVAGVYLSAKGLPKHFLLGYKLFNAGIYMTQFTFPTAIGACIFSTKTIHEAINGFDSGITLCEDCDYVKRASKICKFRMISASFSFDPRRLKQDGYFKTGWKYLHANIHRLVIGEIRDNKINYEFGHYHTQTTANNFDRNSLKPNDPNRNRLQHTSLNDINLAHCDSTSTFSPTPHSYPNVVELQGDQVQVPIK